MKYMLLIYADPTIGPTTQSEGEQMLAEYGKFTQEIIDSKELVAGDRLRDTDTATSVRVRAGVTSTTDGPFAETKEFLGGYYVVEAPDLDRAVELAARIPGARYGTIEVRPIWETE
jgi:hypothetical protein